MYTEDEMLMLSGIQHFMFCPRQWALIHIEQQWAENKLTTEGQILHKNVDNPFYRQKNGDVITLRSLHIASKELGLYGVTDAVELIPADSSEDAITHNRYKGYWKPVVGSNPIVPTRILFGILLNDVFFADFSHNNTLSLKKLRA